ncbi:MAG: gliding motility-associated ABC transporter substrate-binding protein GldG [Bacteroidales bacterium]|jgi:ABC-2 type transport system permease protein|nr:gliding motility-associated ABC transporter substrate-binding protein GldG [Bacteroidales bacterium]
MIKKNNSLLRLVGIVVLFVIVIFISNGIRFRIDLTDEGKYTLTESTKEFLSDINERVYVKVYLEGDMPIGLKRLRSALEDQLVEFKAYAGSGFKFEFIDPSRSRSAQVRQRLYDDLIETGISPINFQQRDSKGSVTQQIVFPGLVMSSGKKSVSVNLLKNNPAFSGDENINNSIELLEYELTYALKMILQDKKPGVGFLTGHSEASEIEIADAKRILSEFYDVRNVSLSNIKSLDDTECIIVADPKGKFSERDKYLLDQYLMSGKSVIWFVDQVDVNTDSLRYTGRTMSLVKDLNLNDMFFNYGVRINPILVQDYRCLQIPVNTAPPGQNAQFLPAPWMYMPLLGSSDNDIVKGLNDVKSAYVSSIDFVGDKNITKEVLLHTSELTRVKRVPDFINLSEIRENPSRNDFSISNVPVAVLLQGNFQSVFKNRVVSDLERSTGVNFVSVSEGRGKMILVADADIIKNEVAMRAQGKSVMPVGYDRFSKKTYGNADFIRSIVNYMCDNNNLTSLKSGELSMRLIDKKELLANRKYWQVINVVVPLLVIVILGVIITLYRKRRYAVKRNR